MLQLTKSEVLDMIRIGVDAMGGDFGLNSTIKASEDIVKEYKDVTVVLYGKEEEIKKRLTTTERIEIVNCPKVLDMGEHNPILTIRKEKDEASLCVAMQAAKKKEVDCVVTSGPTQCVVVAAHLLIKRLPQVERIALCPIIPNLDGKPRLLLDVGANTSLRPEHISLLANFATVVAKNVLGYENPRVGLLNIGTEEGKGRDVDKETYDVLKANKFINFYGNVEANEVLMSPTEIIINDGFTGNICMKTIEGTAKAMAKMLKEEIKSSLGGKIGYLFMRKNLARFAKRMDSKEIGGAMILGLGCPVIKAHGNSDAYAFKNAIKQGIKMVKNDVIGHVLASLPSEDETNGTN